MLIVFRDQDTEIITQLTYVLQKIFSVKYLYRIFKYKTNHNAELIKKLPKPYVYENVFHFIKRKETIPNLDELKTIFACYKYIFFYKSFVKSKEDLEYIEKFYNKC